MVVSMPVKVWGSERERRSLYFFRTRTVPQLSGCFGSEFWDSLILQAAHYEPAFKHAIIAVGFLHELFEGGDGRVYGVEKEDSDDYFAVQQYNLAIKHLLGPFSTGALQKHPPLECITLTRQQIIRGHHGTALTHVNSGVKILCELQFNETLKTFDHPVLFSSSTPYIPLETLEKLFTSLDTQVTQLTGKHQWNLYRNSTFSKSRFEVPRKFCNVSEARDCLDHHWYRYMYCQIHGEDQVDVLSPEAHQEKCAMYLDLFLNWSAAFDAFLEENETHASSEERQRITMLKIRRLLAIPSFQLKRTAVDDQTAWDPFIPIYSEILTLATRIVTARSPSSLLAKKSFTMDVGMIGPLYDVAAQCRDPILRRQAVFLLETMSRQEGMWDSDLVARVAERVVTIEEEGLSDVKTCADVPDWARISSVTPTFDAEGRRAILRYRRLESPHGTARKIIEEVIEW